MKSGEAFALIILVFGTFCLPNSATRMCGLRTGVVGTVFGGKEASRNSHPWLVALFDRQKNKFFCAGSLISGKHVLSAAHCFQNKGQHFPKPSEYVSAFLGKYDLNVTDEFGSKNSLVWDIILHPDWKFNTEKFDADISIVVLMSLISFNQQIRPVCLPKASYNEVKGVGFIVGWGKGENTGYNRHESTPNQLIIPAVNSSHCYTTFYILGSSSSNRAFCGGYERSGKGPCLGDSGGGFYMKDSLTQTWIVRGIVSASIVDLDRGCDIHKFSIYTNVARFTNWIDEMTSKTNKISWKFIEFKCIKDGNLFLEVDADCHYNYNGEMTKNLRILPSFDGHPTIKSADEIKTLVIFFGPSKHILYGIGKAFPNLEQLVIHDDSVRYYERHNFVNLKKLLRLDLREKQIEFIAEDSFYDLPSLEILSFYKNEIEELPEKMFDKLFNLKFLNCGFNKISHLHKDLFKNNLIIEEIDLRNNLLNQIDVDFTKLPKLIELALNNNDCIDAFLSKKRLINHSLESLEEIQKIVDESCGEDSNIKLLEAWFRTNQK